MALEKLLILLLSSFCLAMLVFPIQKILMGNLKKCFVIKLKFDKITLCVQASLVWVNLRMNLDIKKEKVVMKVLRKLYE